MSKLDLTVKETTLLKDNEIHKDLLDGNKKSLGNIDIDLKKAWMEVFEEDRVKTKGCYCK